MRKETEDWGDYKRLPEELTEFLITFRMLLGTDSVIYTPRLGAFETNERRLANFSESMNLCFIGRNAAVLQQKQFSHGDESTGRRMSNAALRNLEDSRKNGPSWTWRQP